MIGLGPPLSPDEVYTRKCLPKQDANRYYKFSGQKLGEDEDLTASALDRVASSDPASASAEDKADWSCDPAAALMEIKNSAGAHPEKILEPEASHSLEQKKPEASHNGGSSDRVRIGPLLLPDEDYNMRKISSPPTQKKVKRISMGTWASVSFSHIGDEKTLRFVAALRNECVRLGLDFDLLPLVATSLKSALPTGIERALQDLFKNIEKFSTNGKQLGLLIVILPDTRDYDEEVEEVCKDLGVAHHCLPPAAINLRQQLSAANEIYSKFLNQVSYGKEDGDSNNMDEMGEDDISNGKEEDGDSTEMDEMEGDIFNFDEEISSYGDSSEICDKHTREDDGSKVANSAKNCFETNDGMEKPLFGSSGERTYADLVAVKVEPSIEMYWMCASFSYMDVMQLVTFLCDLQIELMDIGMDFSSAPIKIDQVGLVPADIRNYLFSTRDSVSELFTKFGMKGERIRLLLVILLEDTGCHAEVDNVCSSLGVVYQCCLPNDARMPSVQYVKKTAHQIKFKVEQEAMVPLLSVFPTIFIGADLSPGEGSESIASERLLSL